MGKFMRLSLYMEGGLRRGLDQENDRKKKKNQFNQKSGA